MGASDFTRRLFFAGEFALMAATIAAAVYVSHPDEWRPVTLVATLLAIALVGEWFTIKTRAGILSASLGVMVLAMGLLGPGAAGACGAAAIALHSAMARRGPAHWLNNLVAIGVAGFAGGLVVRALGGDVTRLGAQSATDSLVFVLMLFAGVAVLLVLNFVVFAMHQRVTTGRPLGRMTTELFFPLLPGELAVAVIAIILVLAYRGAGLPVLLAAIPVLLIFRQLAVALERSETHAEQLQARTRQLSSFQWGVPAMFMEGLGLRDPTSLRHAAAAASYSRGMAIELGCEEDEQEVIHLAGLLHDIGKFTWSDRLLHPDQLNDEDWAVIRRHPQDGAAMVGKLDGFGPVADAILYHHERVDGGGYPAGLIGNEIPLAARIVAIASAYDSMLRREAFGDPMSPEEAMAELRKGAGSQFDEDLVEVFSKVLDSNGSTYGMNADYKSELAFETRVRKMAEPTTVMERPGGRQMIRARLRARRRPLGAGHTSEKGR